MGKKLDALLGRRFKTSKFKSTAKMAISRLAMLKNQHQARCSIARSDVVEFLNNSNRDRALLRVEQVIKEQNMLDMFVLVESYCHLLMERVKLIEQEKNCPEELKEAIASLIYAATRCGEFPELKEIRAIFTSRYGREFAARAIELRNNCGVNPKIVQKLSTRMPSLENKMKVLKDIALENNIHLPTEAEETVSCTLTESGENNHQKPSLVVPSGVSNPGDNNMMHNEDLDTDEELYNRVKTRRKYRDVADAAQAAFESAAYAAVAARAAVELSRSDASGPSFHPGKWMAAIDPMKDMLQPDKKMHSIQNYDNVKIKERDVVFHEIEDGDEKNEIVDNGDSDIDDEMNDIREGISRRYKYFPLRSEVGMKIESESGNFGAEKITETTELPMINRKPHSVRTRRANRR